MMNAKEAKERALWWKLPSTVRDKIEYAIGQGELEAVYYYPRSLTRESDIIKDICNALKELGYTVVSSE